MTELQIALLLIAGALACICVSLYFLRAARAILAQAQGMLVEALALHGITAQKDHVPPRALPLRKGTNINPPPDYAKPFPPPSPPPPGPPPRSPLPPFIKAPPPPPLPKDRSHG